MTVLLGDLLGLAARENPSGGVLATDGLLHSWADLDSAASRLASCLIDVGVAKGDRVAVLHPKSVWSFVAVHAIVRCGAIMVPLDPVGPSDGIQSVIRFCKPSAIIGAAKTLATKAPNALANPNLTVISAGDLADVEAYVGHDRLYPLLEAVAHKPTDLPVVQPDDLAYIIFTSGSTGDPKGIAHTHRSALAYAENARLAHGLRATDRVAGTSPLHFDMSTLELYATPLAGATAVTITEAELRFPASLSARLDEAKVSLIYAVPYQLRQLSLRGDLGNRDLRALRQVSFGGEQFAPGVLEELAHSLPPAELLNVYGPAEVNGIVSHSWEPHPSGLNEVPIGTAWPGVQLRIVDDDLNEVAAESPGELLAACPSQMVGYWQRPDLNDQCFVNLDGQRWYRTGDIVRRDAARVLHFLGRADTRVKVRGVRLELETIESALSDAPGVAIAVVGVSEDEHGAQHVVAWLLPDGPAPLAANDIRRWCKGRLPDSAIPSDIRVVDALPQSRTGKVDRKSLRNTLNHPENRG